MTTPTEYLGPNLLATIVAATRQSVRERERSCPMGDLASEAAVKNRDERRFLGALTEPGRLNVIAECKGRSPSRGILCADYRPAEIAGTYEAHGAAAISVLTEPTFFDGSLEHLREVRSSVSVPVLCKDFIVTPYQLFEAAASGADAVLLIVAALEDSEIEDLLAEAKELRLGVLVEVHEMSELDRAVAAGAEIIGVNNRDLRTLSVDLNASRRLIERIPPGTVGVAESGLRTSDDLMELSKAGYRAFLIGETLMDTPDPGKTLRNLLSGAEVAGRESAAQGQFTQAES